MHTADGGDDPRPRGPRLHRHATGSRALSDLGRLGLVLVVLAVAAGAWLGWEDVGTTVVAHRAQGHEVSRTVGRWDQATVVAAATTIEQAPRPRPATGREPAVIRIPRFGTSYAVPIHPGVTDAVLARGFGHFKVSAAPGGLGNYALAAHRVTHGEPLRHVLDLRPGNRVYITTRHWSYVYRLDTDPRRLTVTRNGVWVVDFHPVNPNLDGVNPSTHLRLLTLVTCAELFHTDNRTVVFGHLIEAKPRF